MQLFQGWLAEASLFTEILELDERGNETNVRHEAE